jgi:hypothetical protein
MLPQQEEVAPRFGFAHFERRRNPRFSVVCPLEYWQINTSKNLSGRTADVSEGGLLLCIPDIVEVGQKLRLKLFIGDLLALRPIEAIGQVVWKDFHFGKKDEYRMGVKFVEISPGDMEELKTFLEALFKVNPFPGFRDSANLLFDLGVSSETFQDPPQKPEKIFSLWSSEGKDASRLIRPYKKNWSS